MHPQRPLIVQYDVENDSDLAFPIRFGGVFTFAGNGAALKVPFVVWVGQCRGGFLDGAQIFERR